MKAENQPVLKEWSGSVHLHREISLFFVFVFEVSCLFYLDSAY